MKKTSRLVYGLLVVIFLSACEDRKDDDKSLLALLLTGGGTPVTGVSLNKVSTAMLVGGTELLGATITPADASNRDLIWTSSDNSTAIVSTNGLVTGVAAGNATIAVTTERGGFTAVCAVTVSDIPVPVTGVSLNKASTSVIVGSTELLTATIEPASATERDVAWSSSNNGVAVVGKSGKVRGVTAGTATITATTSSGGFTAVCAVTVSPLPVDVTGVTMVPHSVTISVGDLYRLSATVSPWNATNQNVTWGTTNSGKVMVANGLILGTGAGTAYILAVTEDGSFIDSCMVTVNDTFRSVDTPGDFVPVTAGSSTFNMIYVNDRSSMTFFTGTDDSSSTTLTRRFLMADTEVTNKLFADVLNWAIENGKIVETAGAHNQVSATTVQYGNNQLIDLNYNTIWGVDILKISFNTSTHSFAVESGYANHPVVCVSWYGAVIFCNWLTEMQEGDTDNLVYSGITDDWYHSETVETATLRGYRLPLRHEWELAARYKNDANNDGDIRDAGEYYPGDYASGASDDYTDADATGAVAWYDDNSDSDNFVVGTAGIGGTTARTGNHNLLGIYDMSGNVHEWCFTLTGENWRVYRGGCAGSTTNHLQIGYVFSETPVGVSPFTGFRIVRTK